MTGTFHCIMRPKHCWTALHVSVLAVLILTLNADSEESECTTGIGVRRNTVHNVSLGQKLRIKCPVIFCNNKPPKVSWYKIEGTLPFNISSKSRITTEWETLKQSEGASYLIFQNILENDAGVYRCEFTNIVGHSISVNVSDNDERSSVTQTNDTTQKDGSNQERESTEDLLIYVYCAAGITSFVIIVIIISIIAMKGCKGKTKKEAQSENYYMSMPMVEQPVNLRVSPRGSPCVPPSRRSTHRKSPSRQPNELRSSRDDEQLYQINVDRNRQRQVEERSVVYAALNHELPQRTPARRPRPVEEQSEYAAIRVG